MSDDRALRDRLANLAAAVPVPPPSPASTLTRRPVTLGPALRRPVSRSWLPVALVAVLVVAAVGILASGSQPAYGPVVETVRQGDFELTIRAEKGRYAPGEPIKIEASLAYVGPEPSIEIGHAFGARQSAISFGIVEPVIGDLRLQPYWEAICAPSTLTRDGPVKVPYQKFGGWDGSGPRGNEQGPFMLDPVLRLEAGTWHVFAEAWFSIGGCDPPDYRLRAEIAITVGSPSPSPTESPSQTKLPVPTEATNPPQSATDRDGDFELTLRSDKTRYAPNEQIDLVTTLTYVGAGESATFWHDSAGALDVGVREPIHGIDLMHVSLLTCDQTTIQRDNPLSVRGLAGVVFVPDDPAAEWVRGFLDSPLRLPIGVWHVYASAQTACMDHGPRSDLSAEITIVVEGDAPIVEWQQIPLMTADRPNLSGGCRMAHGGGRLAPNETSGIGVGSGDGSSAPIRWPFGYTGWRDGDDVVLVDADGRVVGRTGQTVEFAGGFGVDGIFGACWG